MHVKAGVDFHVYTTHRFLELSKINEKQIDKRIINEVEKINKRLEERKRMMAEKISELEEDRELDDHIGAVNKYSIDKYIISLELLISLLGDIRIKSIHPTNTEEIESLLHKSYHLRRRAAHGAASRLFLSMIHGHLKQATNFLTYFANEENVDFETYSKITEYKNRVGDMQDNFHISL